MSLGRLANSAGVLSLHDALAGVALAFFATLAMMTTWTIGSLVVITALVGRRVNRERVLQDLTYLVIIGGSEVLPAAAFLGQVSEDINVVHLGRNRTPT